MIRFKKEKGGNNSGEPPLRHCRSTRQKKKRRPHILQIHHQSQGPLRHHPTSSIVAGVSRKIWGQWVLYEDVLLNF